MSLKYDQEPRLAYKLATCFAVGLILLASAIASTAPVRSESLYLYEREVNREIFEGVRDKHRSQMWHNGEQSEYSVLIVHGLFSSPFFVTGLKEKFAAKGINGVSFLLSGHWRNPPDALNYISYEDWIADFETAYKIASGLGKKVIIVGHSTGALLGVRKALEEPANLAGLAIAAPALALQPKLSFAGLFSGIDILNTERVCAHIEEPNFLCRILIALAPNARSTILDGGFYSVKAGQHVLDLINSIYRERRDDVGYKEPGRPGIEESSYVTLWRIYEKVKVPVFMVTADKDRVVSNRFARQWFNYIKVPKKHIRYDDDSGVVHENIWQSKRDTTPELAELFNPHFEDLTKDLFDFFHLN